MVVFEIGVKAERVNDINKTLRTQVSSENKRHIEEEREREIEREGIGRRKGMYGNRNKRCTGKRMKGGNADR